MILTDRQSVTTIKEKVVISNLDLENIVGVVIKLMQSGRTNCYMWLKHEGCSHAGADYWNSKGVNMKIVGKIYISVITCKLVITSDRNQCYF